MAKFCSECGAALSGSGRFCSECGATTGNASVATASPPQVVPPPAGIMDQLLDRRNLRNIALEDYGDYDVAMEYISLARKNGLQT